MAWKGTANFATQFLPSSRMWRIFKMYLHMIWRFAFLLFVFFVERCPSFLFNTWYLISNSYDCSLLEFADSVSKMRNRNKGINPLHCFLIYSSALNSQHLDFRRKTSFIRIKLLANISFEFNIFENMVPKNFFLY